MVVVPNLEQGGGISAVPEHPGSCLSGLRSVGRSRRRCVLRDDTMPGPAARSGRGDSAAAGPRYTGVGGSSMHGPMVMTHEVLAIPDRLSSLIVLVAFWIPPVAAGWVAAGSLQRSATRARARATHAVLVTFVLGYAAAWFFFNLERMPPYIPGAATDPTFAPPRAVAGLAVMASALVLPGSAFACALAFAAACAGLEVFREDVRDLLRVRRGARQEQRPGGHR